MSAPDSDARAVRSIATFNGVSGAQGRNRTSDTRIFNPDGLSGRQRFSRFSPVKPTTRNQALSGDLSNAVSEEIRDLARLVLRIGMRRHATPESYLEDKHDAADRLLLLADRLECSR
ncbi:hypothetical protein H1W37_03805 [Stappia taiwanensis]|uniref:Uncharacterized protein n=1 Tax=Stappia taiwanensis TaxID=992267 RepID=A0A838XKU4_9HYPH|nr:hypothetical protein [Stappia taiwanensis]MBA4610762.1 hypothetical protein [Stappia taiwanensis]